MGGPEGGIFRGSGGFPHPRQKESPAKMVRYLLIVARNQPDLCHYLKNNFAGDEKVEVILDRRRGERRQRIQPHELERRRGERRRHPGIDKDLTYRSFVIVRLPQRINPDGTSIYEETA